VRNPTGRTRPLLGRGSCRLRAGWGLAIGRPGTRSSAAGPAPLGRAAGRIRGERPSQGPHRLWVACPAALGQSDSSARTSVARRIVSWSQGTRKTQYDSETPRAANVRSLAATSAGDPAMSGRSSPGCIA
jgi:hypothetical protein